LGKVRPFWGFNLEGKVCLGPVSYFRLLPLFYSKVGSQGKLERLLNSWGLFQLGGGKEGRLLLGRGFPKEFGARNYSG